VGKLTTAIEKQPADLVPAERCITAKPLRHDEVRNQRMRNVATGSAPR